MGLQLGLPALPAKASVQVPGVALQTSQAPPHGVAQQTLSAQIPLAHWAARPHAEPLTFLATHAPVSQ